MPAGEESRSAGVAAEAVKAKPSPARSGHQEGRAGRGSDSRSQGGTIKSRQPYRDGSGAGEHVAVHWCRSDGHPPRRALTRDALPCGWAGCKWEPPGPSAPPMPACQVVRGRRSHDTCVGISPPLRRRARPSRPACLPRPSGKLYRPPSRKADHHHRRVFARRIISFGSVPRATKPAGATNGAGR